MDLEQILAASQLYGETRGAQGKRANLSRADLKEANLSRANLKEADLTEADLRWANLNGGDLRWADLTGADLRGANLSGADLTEADLNGADLSGANLSRADLRWADLSRADLRWANLNGADLTEAHLNGAIGPAPVTEEAVELLLQFADTVCEDSNKLRMDSVHHSCGTAHCGAGWICTLSPTAKILETLLGWNAAACLVCPIPEFTKLFYEDNATMLAFAKSVAADRGAAIREKYGLA